MSPDNWATCPKCTKNHQDNYESLKQKANDSYGKINPDEYIKLIESLNILHHSEPGINLAEYYEIGILKNEFFIRYHAHCTKCGFEYKYNLNKEL